LKVDAVSGIKSTDLQIRDQVFGSNFKAPLERTPFCKLLLAALDDFMLKILIVCAFFSIGVDMGFATPEERGHAWIEGFAILVAVAVVSLVGAGSDYKKEGQFLKQHNLEEMSKTVHVKREGKVEEIHKNYIRVGDIIMIENGMNIPVDGVILEATGVMCDESAMTGESDHLPKDTVDKCLFRQREHEQDKGFSKTPHDVPSPVLLSGTQIQTGEGWFLVVVVGEMTCEGQIMASLEDKPNEETPLQQKLDIIATDIGKLGMYAAILIFHCLLLRFFIEGMIRREFDLYGGEINPETGKKCSDLEREAGLCTGMFKEYLKTWLGYIIVGVAIIVVAVPEGLPLAVMISLAYSVSKMLKDQNFVKRLSSCEIMGGANNICSDKTGTLTKNQMTWTQIWAGDDFKVENPDGMEPFDTNQFIKSKKAMELLSQAVSCNSVGTIDKAQATDLAMLKFIKRCGVDFERLRDKYLDAKDMIRFPFDSARKRMSTVLNLGDEKNENGYHMRLHTKGASEIIVETCTHYLDIDGNKQVLDDQMQQKLKNIITVYAKQALRTIGFAYKDLNQGEGGVNHDEIRDGSKIYNIEEGGYTLIGIAGIKDIIREEVPEAVAMCNEAGVRVRMVTGDNLITAIAIAKECGILAEGEENEEHVCMTGPDFAEFVGGLVHKKTREEIIVMGKEGDNEVIGNLENMRLVRNKLKVLARSRPNDKYIMVAGLKQLGDIVAVTGDGTNDAPALKKADVGFAMKTGTQVAAGASDIIIQDDNFASIVKACKWGRNVFDNIRRFLQFQLTVNVVALIISFIGSVVMWDSPLQAIQLLWVNLIMDSLASLALATEEPKPELLQRPPYRKNEYIVSNKMTKHILGQSLFQAVILFVVVFSGHNFIPEDPLTAVITPEIATHPVEEYRSWDVEKVFNGMVQGISGDPIYKPFEVLTPSRHLTFVFNMFVFFQIFNMLAARKINDEKNIFEGAFTNPMFVAVWIIIVAGQFFICQFGSRAMKVHINGLTAIQWVMCVGIGFLALIQNFVLKYVPDRFWPQLGTEKPEEVEEAKKDYQTLLDLAKKNAGLYKKTIDVMK
jgi:Ca2+ transporting ATPase